MLKKSKKSLRRKVLGNKVKLGALNIPDTSINFFEDINLYRKKDTKPKPRDTHRPFRSRRKTQFSK